jgi:hypothetical protein
MDNLMVVFGAIKEHCKEAEVSNQDCFRELEKLSTGRQIFLSLYLYIEVLQRLRLIRFCNQTRGITLTEKGRAAEAGSLNGPRTSILLFMYFVRRVFLFILFWPIFLTLQNTNDTHRKNSAG